MWVGNKECKKTIEKAWDQHIRGCTMNEFSCSINRCRRSLSEWNKSRFGNILVLLKKKRRELNT